MESLIAAFELDHVQKSGANLNEDKLLSVNQQWMRELSPEAFIKEGDLSGPDGTQSPQLLKTVPLLQDRARTFQEARYLLEGELSCLFSTPQLDEGPLVAKAPADSEEDPKTFTKEALEGVLDLMEALLGTETPDEVKVALMPFADMNPKEKGGRGAILWPLRYALSGQERSPDPFTLISIIGPEESVLRIKAALAILN